MIKLNQQVKEEITKEIRKYLEINENKNTAYQNLRSAVKAVPSMKFIAVKAHNKTEERP